jgi:hypothetical protein
MLIELAWFGERLGGRPWRCAVQAVVGAVGVVEVFELDPPRVVLDQ